MAHFFQIEQRVSGLRGHVHSKVKTTVQGFYGLLADANEVTASRTANIKTIEDLLKNDNWTRAVSIPLCH
jgi:hypothetical protein